MICCFYPSLACHVSPIISSVFAASLPTTDLERFLLEDVPDATDTTITESITSHSFNPSVTLGIDDVTNASWQDLFDASSHQGHNRHAAPSLQIDDLAKASWEDLLEASSRSAHPLGLGLGLHRESIHSDHDLPSPPPLEELKLAEPTVTERKIELENVRKGIFEAAGVRLLPPSTQDRVVFPYEPHSSPHSHPQSQEQLLDEYLVRTMKASTQRPPWLWTLNNKRYLIRVEGSNTATFDRLHGFRDDSRDRVYFSAWKEMDATPQRKVFAYLGVLRGPYRHKARMFWNKRDDKFFLHFGGYRMVGGSMFSPELQQAL